MKKIKYILIIALVFMFGLTTVFAEGPKPETSELVVGGKVLYQRGQKTSEVIPGASFDDSTMTLTLTGELNITNGEGIKIIDMGDVFNIMIDGNPKINLVERNDGLFIINTKVSIDSLNGGVLEVIPIEGSGIIVEGQSELHAKTVGLAVVSVRYTDAIVDITGNTSVIETTFYRDNQEEAIEDIRLVTTETTTIEMPEDSTNKDKSNFKRRDSFSDVAVYAIVAGLLLVGGVVVILMAVKNQKK